MANSKAIVLVFKSDGMGMAPASAQDLRERLAGTFLRLVSETDALPRAICFYTDGIKLVCEGSPLLDPLKALEEKGVRLIVCQTCLNFFGLTDRVRVGIVGGMADILTAMWTADTVIAL